MAISNNKVRQAREQRPDPVMEALAGPAAAAEPTRPDRLTEALSGYRGMSGEEIGNWGRRNLEQQYLDQMAQQDAQQQQRQAMMAAVAGALGGDGGGFGRGGSRGGRGGGFEDPGWTQRQAQEAEWSWRSAEAEKEHQRQLDLMRYKQAEQAAAEQANAPAANWRDRLADVQNMSAAGQLSPEAYANLLQSIGQGVDEPTYQAAVMAALQGAPDMAFAKAQLEGLDTRRAMEEKLRQMAPSLTEGQRQAMLAAGQEQFAGLKPEAGSVGMLNGAATVAGAGLAGAGILHGIGAHQYNQAADAVRQLGVAARVSGGHGVGKLAASPGVWGNIVAGAKSLPHMARPLWGQAAAAAQAHPVLAAILAALLGVGALGYGAYKWMGSDDPSRDTWEDAIQRYAPKAGAAPAEDPEEIERQRILRALMGQ